MNNKLVRGVLGTRPQVKPNGTWCGVSETVAIQAAGIAQITYADMGKF